MKSTKKTTLGISISEGESLESATERFRKAFTKFYMFPNNIDFQLSNGSVWRLPMQIIINSKANFLLENMDDMEAALCLVNKQFRENSPNGVNEAAILEWFWNNMDFKDYKYHLKMILPPTEYSLKDALLECEGDNISFVS